MDHSDARRITRRLRLLIAAVLSFLMVAAAVLFVLFENAWQKPNLLLISIDTLRADHLGSYGYSVDTSPILDAFAKKQAILFETVVAAAPSTTPSHASIFTSLLPVHHGAFFSRRVPLPPEHVTMAEILKGEGYRTVSINDGGQMDAMWGLSQGFDEYVTLPGVSIKAKFARNVKRVFRWLDDNAEAKTPWFMFLHTYETHHPYNPDAEFYNAIGHKYSGALPDAIDKTLLQEINNEQLSVDEEDKRHIIAAYDAEIRSMDDAFGVLLSGLADRDLMENTIIVFTSDHGEELGEHGMMGWHSHALWDEQLLVPLLIGLPDGSGAGARISDQVRGIDMLPTVLELLSIEPLPHAEGRSIMPLVRGEHDEPRPAVSQRDTVSTPVPTTLRIGTRKAYWRQGEETPLVFDLGTDPAEKNDLFESDEEAATELRTMLDALITARPQAFTETEVELNGTVKAQLESLGYINSGDAGRIGGDK